MRAFNKEMDLNEVNHWLFSRGKDSQLEKEDLPSIGYIEPQIAAGFLCQAESRTCFLDGYVANPLSSYEMRSKAIDAITDELIRHAKVLNFRRIIAMTNNDRVIQRAKGYGFKILIREI